MADLWAALWVDLLAALWAAVWVDLLASDLAVVRAAPMAVPWGWLVDR